MQVWRTGKVRLPPASTTAIAPRCSDATRPLCVEMGGSQIEMKRGNRLKAASFID